MADTEGLIFVSKFKILSNLYVNVRVNDVQTNIKNRNFLWKFQGFKLILYFTNEIFGNYQNKLKYLNLSSNEV